MRIYSMVILVCSMSLVCRFGCSRWVFTAEDAQTRQDLLPKPWIRYVRRSFVILARLLVDDLSLCWFLLYDFISTRLPIPDQLTCYVVVVQAWNLGRTLDFFVLLLLWSFWRPWLEVGVKSVDQSAAWLVFFMFATLCSWFKTYTSFVHFIYRAPRCPIYLRAHCWAILWSFEIPYLDVSFGKAIIHWWIVCLISIVTCLIAHTHVAILISSRFATPFISLASSVQVYQECLMVGYPVQACKSISGAWWVLW
jgi:hypothetical protein